MGINDRPTIRIQRFQSRPQTPQPDSAFSDDKNKVISADSDKNTEPIADELPPNPEQTLDYITALQSKLDVLNQQLLSRQAHLISQHDTIQSRQQKHLKLMDDLYRQESQRLSTSQKWMQQQEQMVLADFQSQLQEKVKSVQGDLNLFLNELDRVKNLMNGSKDLAQRELAMLMEQVKQAGREYQLVQASMNASPIDFLLSGNKQEKQETLPKVVLDCKTTTTEVFGSVFDYVGLQREMDILSREKEKWMKSFRKQDSKVEVLMRDQYGELDFNDPKRLEMKVYEAINNEPIKKLAHQDTVKETVVKPTKKKYSSLEQAIRQKMEQGEKEKKKKKTPPLMRHNPSLDAIPHKDYEVSPRMSPIPSISPTQSPKHHHNESPPRGPPRPYNIQVSDRPVFLKRSTIRPVTLKFLENPMMVPQQQQKKKTIPHKPNSVHNISVQAKNSLHDISVETDKNGSLKSLHEVSIGTSHGSLKSGTEVGTETENIKKSSHDISIGTSRTLSKSGVTVGIETESIKKSSVHDISIGTSRDSLKILTSTGTETENSKKPSLHDISIGTSRNSLKGGLSVGIETENTKKPSIYDISIGTSRSLLKNGVTVGTETENIKKSSLHDISTDTDSFSKKAPVKEISIQNSFQSVASIQPYVESYKVRHVKLQANPSRNQISTQTTETKNVEIIKTPVQNVAESFSQTWTQGNEMATQASQMTVDSGQNTVQMMVDSGQNTVKSMVDSGQNAVQSKVDAGQNTVTSTVDCGQNTVKLQSSVDYGQNTEQSTADAGQNTEQSTADAGQNTVQSTADASQNTFQSKVDYGQNTVQSTTEMGQNTLPPKVSSFSTQTRSKDQDFGTQSVPSTREFSINTQEMAQNSFSTQTYPGNNMSIGIQSINANADVGQNTEQSNKTSETQTGFEERNIATQSEFIVACKQVGTEYQVNDAQTQYLNESKSIAVQTLLFVYDHEHVGVDMSTQTEVAQPIPAPPAKTPPPDHSPAMSDQIYDDLIREILLQVIEPCLQRPPLVEINPIPNTKPETQKLDATTNHDVSKTPPSVISNNTSTALSTVLSDGQMHSIIASDGELLDQFDSSVLSIANQLWHDLDVQETCMESDETFDSNESGE